MIALSNICFNIIFLIFPFPYAILISEKYKEQTMRIIFIRHGDPDYKNDSLTVKGRREAMLLAQRIKNWDNIDAFYISPLGRAQLTAKYTLDEIGREGKTLDWLKEFVVDVYDPSQKRVHVPWDWLPDYWRHLDKIYDKDEWQNLSEYDNTDLKERYGEVRKGLFDLLSEYGIRKENNVYLSDRKNDDTTIVLFCHLGVSFVCISELLGISPALLWHTFFVATSSVTVVTAEERVEGILNFRVEKLGDTEHLNSGREPVSSSGFYADVFNG